MADKDKLFSANTKVNLERTLDALFVQQFWMTT